jgi:hypothetical protein
MRSVPDVPQAYWDVAVALLYLIIDYKFEYL